MASRYGGQLGSKGSKAVLSNESSPNLSKVSYYRWIFSQDNNIIENPS